MTETPSSIIVSTRLERIAKLAREAPDMAFTTLAHHIDIDWLHEAFRRTRKDGATGVDRQTAEEYATNLEGNLRSLLDRAKLGTYRAPPVRRVHIPKGSGAETRPIGIPTFEDKVLQRAVAMVLEAVYEQSFLDCSYGFRPGRSAHQALDALWNQTMRTAGGWVLEVNVRKFFDTMDHGHIQEILRHRVLDGVLLRLIGKWLNAGVLEDGGITYPDAGSPQGGVVSPIIANIYLHEVLDVWFDREVKPRLSGGAALVRYADDAVLFFANEQDARKVMTVLPKRFGKYGLTLHPEKTRLVEFRRPDKREPPVGGGTSGRAETFDLLGFTHFWGKSRTGKWVVKRSTAKESLSKSARARRRVVPMAPSRRRPRAATRPRVEAEGALRVLRHHRKFPCALSLLARGHRGVAQVAQPPLAKRRHDLGAHAQVAEAVPASAAAHRALGDGPSSKSVIRRAGCVDAHVRICGGPAGVTWPAYPTRGSPGS